MEALRGWILSGLGVPAFAIRRGATHGHDYGSKSRQAGVGRSLGVPSLLPAAGLMRNTRASLDLGWRLGDVVSGAFFQNRGELIFFREPHCFITCGSFRTSVEGEAAKQIPDRASHTKTHPFNLPKPNSFP